MGADWYKRYLDANDTVCMNCAFALQECENCPAQKNYDIVRKKRAKELWEEFEDVPMNPETECIESSWNGFPAGTHREDIWEWFETEFGVNVYALMYGE